MVAAEAAEEAAELTGCGLEAAVQVVEAAQQVYDEAQEALMQVEDDLEQMVDERMEEQAAAMVSAEEQAAAMVPADEAAVQFLSCKLTGSNSRQMR